MLARHVKTRGPEAALVQVGQRLRHFRMRHDLTQEELARAAKLTPKFVSQIENGRVNPSIGVLARLVHDGLDLTFGVFFSWDPQDDLSTIVDLVERQPAHFRKRLVRAIEALCDSEDGTSEDGRRRAKSRRTDP
jgi:transcriptional regulator with XRE-family HTH domain